MPAVRRYTSLEGVIFVWDDSRPGKCWQAENLVWHFGRGTDLQVILFHLNLTEPDKRFLKSLRIGIDY